MEDLKYLEWDSNFFGFPIARLDGGRLTKEMAADVDLWCKTKGIRCLYFMTDFLDPSTVEIAQQFGYKVVNIRIELRLRIQDYRFTPQNKSVVEIRQGEISDLEFLLPIVDESFPYSRFIIDRNFDANRSKELYRIWLRNTFLKVPNDPIYVSLIDGRLVGFFTGSITGDTGIGELMAVSSLARGKGIGSVLLNAIINHFESRGVKEVIFPTHSQNIAAQRIYAEAGFKTASVSLWFHKWYDQYE